MKASQVPLTLAAAAALSLTALARAADFTVTNTNSSGPGSLFDAITQGNNLPGPDRILFNIPGPGVHRIDVGKMPLPTVVESLVIDGYSQPGAEANSLAVGNNASILIQIDGGEATMPTTGLILDRGSRNGNLLSADYIVRGLSLTGFIAQLETNNTTIHSSAIGVTDHITTTVIAGNFIGLLPDGETARGNHYGISSSGATTVGGTDAASRNVISGNTGAGWTSAGSTGVGIVLGNHIGTNASGSKAVPNATGVFLVGAATNIIGGTATGSGNLISGNAHGILLGELRPYPGAPSIFIQTPGSNSQIKGNRIGVQADGVTPLPNRHPIKLLYGSNNIIGGLEPGAGNLIVFNGSGIDVARIPSRSRFVVTVDSKGNRILSNSIYANGGLAIDLGSNGATPNDPGDPDEGPNDFQNAPVIVSTQVENGSVTINGLLNSTANTAFTLQYFSESLDLARPIQSYLGSTSVTTDADGNAPFSAVFPNSDPNVSFNMTATSESGNTSEFARNPGRMENISTRALVRSGDDATIAGFIVNSDAFLVLRALGPSLANHGLSGLLPDPVLEIYDSTGKLIASNDNWRTAGSADYIESLGLAPTHDSESALNLAVPAGSYTAVVRDAHGASGLGVVEIYNRIFTPTQVPGKTMNLSTRGVVQTGDNVMIAGLILEPITGSTRMVARALGPSLAAAGIAHPLADPRLELHDTQGSLIASNDDWGQGQPDALSAVGLAPPNDSEAAIFVRLPAGSYTAIVRGNGSDTGVALVEWYNLH